MQVFTHHSTGNLMGKGDQVNRPQLSQGTVRLFIGGGNLWEWRGWADAPVAEQGAVRGWCHGSHGSGGSMVDVFIAMALEGLRRWQLKVAGAILQWHRQKQRLHKQPVPPVKSLHTDIDTLAENAYTMCAHTHTTSLVLTNFLIVLMYVKRSPCGTYSNTSARGSCKVQHPTMLTR